MRKQRKDERRNEIGRKGRGGDGRGGGKSEVEGRMMSNTRSRGVKGMNHEGKKTPGGRGRGERKEAKDNEKYKGLAPRERARGRRR